MLTGLRAAILAKIHAGTWPVGHTVGADGNVFLTNIMLLLAASIPIVILLRRVDLPPLAGFIITGALLGPHALGWICSIDEVEALAEIGVALLLFTVGLEFSLPHLLLQKRALLVGGGVPKKNLQTTDL